MEIVMPKNTQRLQIISHLKNKGSITTAAAFTLYGITRLAVYICMLRKDGYDIQDKWVKNDFTGHRWKKYTLNPNVIAKDTGVAFIDDTVAVVMNTYEEELARKNPHG